MSRRAGGALEIYAIAGGGAIAGISALSAGLVLGGLGIAAASTISCSRSKSANHYTISLACGQAFSMRRGGVAGRWPRYIINFPTKRHWRGKSRIEDIELGLVALVKEVQERKIGSIAVPPLGCGLGGLDWSEVRPRIERAFADVPDVRVVVFEPSDDAAASRMSKAKEIPKATAGRAVLVGLMQRYLAGLMDPVVSLLEVHKPRKPGSRCASTTSRVLMARMPRTFATYWRQSKDT